MKRAGKTGPFGYFYLLPVGLADFMGQTLRGNVGVVNGKFTAIHAGIGGKKPRLFKGRGQSTGRKSPPVAAKRQDRQVQAGRKRLRMYLCIARSGHS